MSSYLMLTAKDRVIFYSDTLMNNKGGNFENIKKIYQINDNVVIGCLQHHSIAGISFVDLVAELRDKCSNYEALQIQNYLLTKFKPLREKINVNTILLIVSTKKKKVNTIRIFFPRFFMPPANKELSLWDASGDVQLYFNEEIRETILKPFSSAEDAHKYAKDMFGRTMDAILERNLPLTTCGFDYCEILFEK